MRETEEEAKRNTDVLRGTEMNKRWRETDRIEQVAEVSERAAGTIRFSVGSRFLFLPLL